MAQPPLSQGIQRLERHLGQRLFDRDARRVVLTPAGAALLPDARALVDQANVFVDGARGWTDDLSVQVGLAVDLDHIGSRVLACLAESGVTVTPQFAGSRDLLGRVREGDLDIALVRHPCPIDGLLVGDVLTVDGTLDAGPLDDGLPVVVPARHHHPAAHDQFVDSLRLRGYDNPIREVDLYQERQAWIGARLGCGIRLDPLSAEPGRPESVVRLPMRFRVVAPVVADQRPGIDHVHISQQIESVLQ